VNIADYFKVKPSKPVDALVHELKQNSDSSFIQTLYIVNKSETEALVDTMFKESQTYKDKPAR
jgi:hypothetical protein